MSKVEDRLTALEQRLSRAEDELAVIRLVASYGPMVDTGLPDHAPQLMSPDGYYDAVGARMSQSDFATMLSGPDHQGVVAEGIAHVMGLPWVRVDGDKATAVNCTQLYHKVDGGYEVWRVAQNHWKLERRADGWKIVDRVNRPVGEGDDARALLENAI